MNALLKWGTSLALVLLSSILSVNAQITMTNGSVTTCNDVFLDPGGFGNYANGATITMTIYPTTPGDGVCLDFTLWDLDYSIFGWSELSFYDGTTTGAPLIMTATGDWEVNAGGTAFDFTGPGMVCANGPMTIEWDPDDTGIGWEANISCFTPLGTAGCNITANNDTTICSGDAVNLAAVGNVINVPLSNDFNNSTIGTGWSSTVNARFDNPCGAGLDGTPHLWMGVEPAPRTLQSGTYDVSNGGTISFDFRMAIQAQASPCEGPDLADEGIYVQYSTNGGTTWTTIHYFFPPFYTDGSQHCSSWQNYVLNIPPAAQTAATSFRWIQNEISSSSTDHWGMDNVAISFPNTVTFSWDQGLGVGASHTVNPTATTTYTATVTDGNVSCSESVVVTVNNCGCMNPTVTVNNPAAVCAPNTIDLNNAVTVTAGSVITFHNLMADANGDINPIGAVVNTSGTYWIRAEDPGDPTCYTVDQITVTINPAEDASFNYTAGTYCLGGATPTPTISGTGSGAFTFTPAGLVINGSTGEINLTTSTAGTYSVTYTTPGTCFDDSTVSITITNAPDATFNYDATNYCITGTNPILTLTGSAGTFSSTPAGLSLNTSTGAIDLSLSNAGTYTVNNDISASGSCPAVNANVTVTVDPQEDPGFNYSAGTFCVGGTNPTPTITGVASGAFTFTPAGLAINGSTGEINLTTSTAGTYSVTYTTPGTCFDDSTVSITITTSPDATFNYDATNYCITGANPILTLTGSAGTFSSTPAGLSLNTTTGAIDLSLSNAGTYTVNNDISASGSCPAVNANVTVTIDPQEDPGFTYGSTTFCLGGTNPTPTITGVASGAFTFTPAGLAISGSTGEIDLTTSTAGTYSVTYTTPGTCFNDSTVSITITNSPDATFNYDATNYCITGANPILTLTGSAGTFSSTPAGLSLNTTTGAIDLSLSNAGTYTVNNDISASGSCPAVNFNVQVTVDPQEDPGFTYGSTTFCLGGTNPTPTITGVVGGNFTAMPVGLSINANTGDINLGLSTAGTYSVTYTTPGSCFDDSTLSITLTTAPDASFNYDATDYCLSGNNPVITLTGSAGTFSSTPAGLDLNPTTGAVDLANSTAGVYTITNSIAASGGCPAASVDVIITITPNPAPPNAPSPIVYCDGDAITPLTATGIAGTLEWFSDATLQTSVGTGTSYDPGALAVGTYTYYVVETLNGCVGSPSLVTVTVNPAPTNDGITGGGTLCPGETVTLSTSGTGTLSWSTGQSSSTISVQPFVDTWYYATYSNGCGSVTDSVLVVASSGPLAEAGDSITISLGESTTLNGSGGASYVWTPSSTLDCPTCQTPMATPPFTTTYLLTVTDGNGCVATDSVVVVVTNEFDVFVPNIFSPDGDGYNDVFFVRGEGIASLEFLVFDRWGEKMFESNSTDQGWDGTFRDKRVPSGVYVYFVRAYGYTNLEPVELKGNVTILR